VPAVELLDAGKHDRSGFTCGEGSLDHYLQHQAAQHQRDGISTTHVLAEGSQILAYCTLAAGELELSQLQSHDQRRLPRYPVPAVRMARLAVARDEQRKGHGDFMIGFAAARALSLRETLGVRVLVVDALDEQASNYYKGYGFRSVTDGSLTLYLPISAG
jgi:ribosomal protein S18 acetylase RimI-like enzyme